MDKTEELLTLVKNGEWDRAESQWLDILDEGINDIEPFAKTVKILWNRGQRKLAIELLDISATTFQEADNQSMRLEILRLLAQYNPIFKGLGEQYADAFKKKYGDRTYLANWIEQVQTKGLSTSQLITTLDKLIVFKKGSVVEHRSGWGLGVIKELKEDRIQLIVDLEQRPDHKMDALAAADCLTPLQPDSYEVMRKFEPDILREDGKNNPVALLARLLKYTGEPTNAQTIKSLLSPDIIDKSKWSQWWTKTRKLLIADPYIDVSPGSHAKYSLREEPLPWEDEIRMQFDQAENLNQPTIILEYLKNSAEKKHLNDFAKILSKIAKEHCFNKERWFAFECYLVYLDCVAAGAETVDDFPDLKERIFCGDAMSVFARTRLQSLAQKSWKILIENSDNWQDKIGMVFKKGSDLARDTMFRALAREKKYHEHIFIAFQEIMNSRLSYPEAFIWCTRYIVQERLPGEQKLFDLVEIFVDMVETGGTFRSIGQGNQAKKLAKNFTPALGKKLTKALEKERAHRVLNILLKNTWLPSSFWKNLKGEIQEKYPKLFSTVKPIYTTRTGLEKYERELQDLFQNKIPENTRAIGHALSFGDLSENAELDAAREIQWQLMGKAQEMRNNISRASVIDFSLLNTDEIAVGNAVILQDEEGKNVEYVILGPWDVDMENGIISFMSPIGKKVIGARKGDILELQTGKFRVMKIKIYQEEENKEL